jgi:hypothetical protein
MNRISQILKNLINQITSLKKVLFFTYLPVFILFGVIVAWAKTSESVAISMFFRDIAATADLPFYVGFISQLGVVLWCASAVVCFFAYVLVRKGNPRNTRSARFLLHSAIVTTLLLFDDLFLFHEEIAPNYLFVKEKFVLLFYLILCGLYLIANRDEILSLEYALMVLALTFFVVSVFIDKLPEVIYENIEFIEENEVLFEDGFKFMGIVTWFLFLARYSYSQVLSSEPSREK